MPIAFADRLNNVETSALRELFKLLGKPTEEQLAGDIRSHILRSVEESLRRLQRSHVTLLQLHNGLTKERADEASSVSCDRRPSKERDR